MLIISVRKIHSDNKHAHEVDIFVVMFVQKCLDFLYAYYSRIKNNQMPPIEFFSALTETTRISALLLVLCTYIIYNII